MEKLINDFSFGLFFWQLLILIVIVFILGIFAWKPIISALESREKGIADALSAADNARRELDNLKTDNEKLLAEARVEKEAIIKEAHLMKDKIVSQAKAEAEQQGEKIINQAKVAIESEKIAAIAELKTQVSSISVEIAEKLLNKKFEDKEAQLELIDRLLDETEFN